MATHTQDILQAWYPHRDSHQWVLGTVVGTIGSSYRKAGALLLINDMAQLFGLISGGCLEADLMRRSKRVMTTGGAELVSYDSRDEDDVAFQLGLGCGGKIDILLQPVTAENHYLQLVQVYQSLIAHQPIVYCSPMTPAMPNEDGHQIGLVASTLTQLPFAIELGNKAKSVTYCDQHWLCRWIRPRPHLAVFGGGLDAQPLVAMAANLGWEVSVVDPRPSYGRSVDFPTASRLLNSSAAGLEQQPWLESVDAVVIMNHHIDLDVEAIQLWHNKPLSYWAVLGPEHRKQRLFDTAGIQPQQCRQPLAGPAGLSLGGELPEGVALSILAECHAALHGASAQSISGILNDTARIAP
ncbi:xanthine and CO dehydrogenase family maturation factor XdhC/CoxF family protein [Neiella marina]|uniref:Xanthine and CO dehydrogenase family maturation factor XdhC/CoxF family protein n=1 Tax=Neiella marina TaxID=508461 RepID=A0A8J2XRA7_9GAMM|nr:XdhC/CoxI family protein [Neiella marina]GGA88331.1 xanthine and CO dehydrogenase family maturation factor XdhC/CoxF family protein [Neiella marina]